MASSGHSAIAEMFGGAVSASPISADYSLRLPYGQNCARAYIFTAASTYNVVLPNTDKLYVPAGPLYTIVVAAGSSTLNLRDHLGNLVRAMTVSTGWDVYWTGTLWVTFATPAPITSTPLAETRVVVSVQIKNSTTSGINIQTFSGYAGTAPAAVTCEVFPGVAIGGWSTGTAALHSGTWPAGTTLLLMIGAGSFVTGRGGKGGRGRDAAGGPLSHLPAGAGLVGGPAIEVTVDTAIVNRGTIQGGGGGGGGGDRGSLTMSSVFPGGGGGGGAGLAPSEGGLAGLFSSGTATGSSGAPGTLQLGGSGGSGIGTSLLVSGNGGNGGSPGTAGSAGSVWGTFGTAGAGGAAGAATRRPVARSLTYIASGTVLGADTTY